MVTRDSYSDFPEFGDANSLFNIAIKNQSKYSPGIEFNVIHN